MCVEVLDPAVELARPSWVVSYTEIQKHVYITVQGLEPTGLEFLVFRN